VFKAPKMFYKFFFRGHPNTAVRVGGNRSSRLSLSFFLRQPRFRSLVRSPRVWLPARHPPTHRRATGHLGFFLVPAVAYRDFSRALALSCRIASVADRSPRPPSRPRLLSIAAGHESPDPRNPNPNSNPNHHLDSRPSWRRHRSSPQR
jgi:hypothetical protein